MIKSLLFTFFNLIILLITIYHARGVNLKKIITLDFITILLAAISVLLAILGVFIAILAIWGYKDMLNKAVAKASAVASEEATRIASEASARIDEKLDYKLELINQSYLDETSENFMTESLSKEEKDDEK